MKQQRKIDLLHCFPVLPGAIAEQMQGRGALNFCVFLTYGHELFVRCYHRYTNGTIAERQRYVFAKDGAVRYILDDYCDSKWRIATKFTEPRFAARGYPYSFDNTYAILNADAYKWSDMKYSQVDKYHFYCPMLYLRLYVRHPNIEYLLKSGYRHLIEENQHSYYSYITSVKINWRVNLKSNNLLKMLGLNREEFKLLKGWEKRYDNYLYYREAFPQYKPPEVMEIVKAYGYERGTLDSHTAYTGLKPLRIARYLNEQQIEPRLYGDYLDQCRQLGYNLRDTAISLPHDFHTMHARLSQLTKIKADEKTRRAFAENMQKRARLAYAEQELFVRQPKSVEEIVHEGEVLSHCVGGYAERHAKGVTTILFIRKAAEPDKPFFTVEVDNSGKIRQCYGDHNTPATAEIEAFRKRYQHYLTEVFENAKRTERKLQQSA